jgi:predicted RNase H-like nuclease (RuvC/YqgF family)
MGQVKPLHEVMTKEEMSKIISEYTQVIESYRIENEELKQLNKRLNFEIGKYAGRFQELSKKMELLSKEMLGNQLSW